MRAGMRKLIPIACRSEQGVALLSTLILMTLLAAIGGSGTILSRADLFVSQNLLSGVQALWLAQAGAEVGKNWLEHNLPGAAFPIAIGPEALGAGIYTVQIEDLDDGQYRITAVGEGHDASRRVVEEVVHIPQFTPLGVVTSIGDGLHPDFTDSTSSPAGSGHRIPDFSIDGRNHAADGTLSPLCPDIAPFAVSQVEAQTDLINALNSLKQKIVGRANRFCHADGSSSAFGSCPFLSILLTYLPTSSAMPTPENPFPAPAFAGVPPHAVPPLQTHPGPYWDTMGNDGRQWDTVVLLGLTK